MSVHWSRKGERLFAAAVVVAAAAAVVVVLVTRPNDEAGNGKPAAQTSSAPSYASPAELLRALASADTDITVGGVAPDPGTQGLIDFGGQGYSVPLTRGAQTFDCGVNMFDAQKGVADWNRASQGLGGVAVVGANWAISLPTTDARWVADSKSLAKQIAAALNADVSLPE